jgi:hypothetical protein
MKKNDNLLNEKGSASIVFAALVTGLISVMMTNMSSSGLTINSLHSAQKERQETSQNIINLSLQFKQSYNLGLLDPTCGRFTNTTLRQISGINFCFPSTDGLCVVSRDAANRNVRNCASVQQNSIFWQGHPRINGNPSRAMASDQNLSAQEQINANTRLLNGFDNEQDYSDDDYSSDDDHNSNGRLGFYGRNERAPTNTQDLRNTEPVASVQIKGTNQVPTNSINIPAQTQPSWKTCSGNDLCIRVALCEVNVTNCSTANAVATQVVRLGPIN